VYIARKSIVKVDNPTNSLMTASRSFDALLKLNI